MAASRESFIESPLLNSTGEGVTNAGKCNCRYLQRHEGQFTGLAKRLMISTPAGLPADLWFMLMKAKPCANRFANEMRADMQKWVGFLAIGVAAATVGEQVEAAPALDGFEQLGLAGEIIEIRKPLFQSGKLRVGKAVGRVERRARGQSSGFGALGVGYEEIERFGSTRFVVTGTEVNGTLSGECQYDRAEQRIGSGSWSAAFPAAPLRMHCHFARDGRAIGHLRLEGRPDVSKLVQVVQREGEVVINGTRLALRSEHRLGKRRIPTSGPVGYWVENEAGERVGAIDTNGIKRVRLASTGNIGQRDASLAAALALAIFWDPGDTDD